MDAQIIVYGVVGLLGVWCIALTLLFLQVKHFLQQITVGVSKKDLKTLLEEISGKLDGHQQSIDIFARNIKINEELEKLHLQRSALVRYNPFGDTGGNQSFVLSLLNALGNGYVITSLHGRDNTRIYAKEVHADRDSEKRTESYSKEELEAIGLALKKKKGMT